MNLTKISLDKLNVQEDKNNTIHNNGAKKQSSSDKIEHQTHITIEAEPSDDKKGDSKEEEKDSEKDEKSKDEDAEDEKSESEDSEDSDSEETDDKSEGEDTEPSIPGEGSDDASTDDEEDAEFSIDEGESESGNTNETASMNTKIDGLVMSQQIEKKKLRNTIINIKNEINIILEMLYNKKIESKGLYLKYINYFIKNINSTKEFLDYINESISYEKSEKIIILLEMIMKDYTNTIKKFNNLKNIKN